MGAQSVVTFNGFNKTIRERKAMKSREDLVCFHDPAGRARQRGLLLLTALALGVAVGTPAWSAGASDLVYAESNSVK